ncbi:MAG: hypothetical protein ABIO39_14665 [Caulobacteraceae bacterium]
MSEVDEKLAALLREDGPPAHDPVFRLRVLERVARRRLQLRMAGVVGVGVAATGLVAAMSPDLSMAAGSSTMLPAFCVALAILTTVWGLLHLRRPV